MKIQLFERHAHFRRGQMLQAVVRHTARQAWGAIAMPNTAPHLFTTADAIAYATEVVVASDNPNFKCYPAIYLTPQTSVDDLLVGYSKRQIIGAKWYPANGTTNSAEGIKTPDGVMEQLAVMEEHGIPLLVHGEIPSDERDPLHFEDDFLDRFLPIILEKFPKLKVVLEHITTGRAARLVASNEYENLRATVTPQHLLINHGHLFQSGHMADNTFKRGMMPHNWCMPIPKMEIDREELLSLVFSSDRFGAGSDSAPHPLSAKECACCAGGCFSAMTLVEFYALAAHMVGKMNALPGFLGDNLLSIYGISPPANALQLEIIEGETIVPPLLEFEDIKVVPFMAGARLPFIVRKAA